MTEDEKKEMKEVINQTLDERSQNKPTKEEIMKIKDTTERQKAIADNHELFGF